MSLTDQWAFREWSRALPICDGAASVGRSLVSFFFAFVFICCVFVSFHLLYTTNDLLRIHSHIYKDTVTHTHTHIHTHTRARARWVSILRLSTRRQESSRRVTGYPEGGGGIHTYNAHTHTYRPYTPTHLHTHDRLAGARARVYGRVRFYSVALRLAAAEEEETFRC